MRLAAMMRLVIEEMHESLPRFMATSVRRAAEPSQILGQRRIIDPLGPREDSASAVLLHSASAAKSSK